MTDTTNAAADARAVTQSEADIARFAAALNSHIGAMSELCNGFPFAHNAQAKLSVIAEQITVLVSQCAEAEGVSVRDIHTARLKELETASIHRFTDAGVEKLAGSDAAAKSGTWAELQIAQMIHDRQFQPHVHGRERYRQAEHHTFALGTIHNAITREPPPQARVEFVPRQLPDIAAHALSVANMSYLLLPRNSIT